MLRIRLSRTGKKRQPYYRIVVAEREAPVKGKYIDLLGSYNPRSKELQIKKEQLLNWLNKGAQPSNTLSRILLGNQIEHKLIEYTKRAPRASKSAKEDEAPTQTAEAPKQESAEPTGEAKVQEQAEEVAAGSQDDQSGAKSESESKPEEAVAQ